MGSGCATGTFTDFPKNYLIFLLGAAKPIVVDFGLTWSRLWADFGLPLGQHWAELWHPFEFSRFRNFSLLVLSAL